MLRSWNWVRFALGLLQMFGAVFTVAALVQTGLSPLTIAGVCITGVLTTLSVLLFGRNAPRWIKHRVRRPTSP